MTEQTQQFGIKRRTSARWSCASRLRFAASPAALLFSLMAVLFAATSPAISADRQTSNPGANENWERFFGGPKRETSFAIASFHDGSTISVGYTRSKKNGDADILLLRLDASGTLMWQKTYGGDQRDMATSVAILPDGGFVTAAISQPSPNSQGDALIMRHNKNGSLVWRKTFGGPKYDIPYAIKVNRKGQIIVAGYTKSSGPGGADGWVFCLNGQGNKVWERTLGTKGRDWLRALTVSSTGIITAAGGTKANKNAKTYSWAVQLDPKGKTIWNKTYRSAENVARAIIQLKDNQLAIAGWKLEKDSITGRDIWVAKLNGSGELIWEKRLGGSGDDHTEALIALPNGHLALAGGTTRNLAVITVRTAWMMRLNKRGKLVWRRSFEGKSDQLYGLSKLPNGKLVAAGASWRRDKGSDAWILTLDDLGRRWRKRKSHSKRPSKTSIR